MNKVSNKRINELAGSKPTSKPVVSKKRGGIKYTGNKEHNALVSALVAYAGRK